MGTQKIVIGDKQGGRRDGAIIIAEAMQGADVTFVGPIKPLDQLLELTVGFRFGIEIFQSDDLMQLDGRFVIF